MPVFSAAALGWIVLGAGRVRPNSVGSHRSQQGTVGTVIVVSTLDCYLNVMTYRVRGFHRLLLGPCTDTLLFAQAYTAPHLWKPNQEGHPSAPGLSCNLEKSHHKKNHVQWHTGLLP